ncbi:MAG: L-fuculose kinase [Proteobacteria bacterium]|nr:L-fuculose kinase [Pseudomonadota bacterium]
MQDLIAVFDVGKTNTKLSLIRAANGEVVRSVQRANRPVEDLGMNQLDLAGMERWLIESLRDLPERQRITAVVPVGHGAACALLDTTGQLLAAPDYEDPCFRESATDYDGERDPYSETRSPRLPDGQNLGAQLFFLETRRPAVFARIAHILLLPQYWAWRLSGDMAAEVSSLGAHSDLWQPRHTKVAQRLTKLSSPPVGEGLGVRGEFSRLAQRRGWSKLFPPLRAAGDLLGPLRQEIQIATGLPGTCQVACGLHDSNASWLWHLSKVRAGADLTVISSGTWTIAMKSRADLDRLREARDMLANVDVFSAPVATARFMGGREYATIMAGRLAATPTVEDLRRVVIQGAMALPAFAEAGGPFHGRAGRIVATERLSDAEWAAMATAYVVLVTEVILELLGDSDNIVVDGPFAQNPLFAPLLKTLRPDASVFVSSVASGATAGALVLILGDAAPAAENADRSAAPLEVEGLAAYRSAWRAQCVDW